MSRDNFDIPEVFRRAMEEAGWSGEGNREGGNGGDGGGGGDGNGRQPFPSRQGSSRPNRGAIIIGILVLLFLSLNGVVATYTDWLWFTALDYQSVWLTQWSFRIVSLVIFFAISLLFFLLNWHVARRRAIRETPPFNPKFLQLRLVKWTINGIAIFLSFGFANSISSNWQQLLRFVHRQPFGEVDPIFGMDASFYLFELPIYELFQQWLISLLIFTIIITAVIYAINNIIDIQRGQWQPLQSVALRQHVALLAGFVLVLWTVGYLFSLYNLLYSPRGVVFGASYTDLNVSQYTFYAQMIVMGLIALAFFYNIFRLDLRPIAILGGIWLLVSLVGGGILPGLVQRYSVDPNEIERESPYIAHNIDFTRLGFGLNTIELREFGQLGELTEADFDDNEQVLENIRLWDYRPLQVTYEQLQSLRPYYQFSDVDIDRYVINGEVEQVMLAARELDKNNLNNPTWVNLNLEFTHGYGIVMNPVDKVSAVGQPEFYIQDLPPRSSIDIQIERPEIYYGENTRDAVFVGSDRDELSYPQGQTPVYSSYAGEGGVVLDSYLKRVAYALLLGEANVLLSDDINRQTRVQYNRDIRTRINEITPGFFLLDPDPYIVIWNGRLVWIQDAYTISNRFPYSEPITLQNGLRLNYIRNSVKIVMDAYEGDVTYYIADDSDPIIQVYDQAFPGLFKPLDNMPESLQAHIRYPELMFSIQSNQYLKYHIEDVRVFYNEEDLWEIPTEKLASGNEQLPIEPYYVILRLPSEESSEYLLIQPFVPKGRENMVAWMAARNDGEDYGQLIVYQLPRQEFVIGPSLVEARIDQQPEISQQFTLWDQSGSNVIRGNLLTIPLTNNFLYIEPIYLQASENAVPELRRVIVATSTQITMRPTLEEALDAIIRGEATAFEEFVPEGADVGAIDSTAGDGESPGELVPEAPIDATVEQLIESANSHFEAAQEAQRAGDWTTYGQELEALQRDLQRLSELTGTQP